MPLLLDVDESRARPERSAHHQRLDAGAAGREPDASWITIGLVNNMPDGALQATERQFVGLLGAAAGPTRVHLRSYALLDVPRSDRGHEYVRRCCTMSIFCSKGPRPPSLTSTMGRIPMSHRLIRTRAACALVLGLPPRM